MNPLSAQDPTSPEAALGGLVLLIGGLALSPLVLALARRVHPQRIVFFARWRFAHLFAVVLAMLASSWLWAPLLGALGPEWPQERTSFALSLLVLASGALLALFFAHRLDPRGVASLGLWPGGHLRAVLLGAAAYLVLLPAVLGLEQLWPFVWTRLGGEFEEQAILRWIRERRGVELLAVASAAVLLQPLLEELLFRGFLQPLLVQNLGDRGGVAVTAAVFALLHGASAFLPIFGLALLLGAIMLRTQRLSAVWAVHALHNGLMLALVFALPEGARASGG